MKQPRDPYCRSIQNPHFPLWITKFPAFSIPPEELPARQLFGRDFRADPVIQIKYVDFQHCGTGRDMESIPERQENPAFLALFVGISSPLPAQKRARLRTGFGKASRPARSLGRSENTAAGGKTAGSPLEFLLKTFTLCS
ncbi:MAG: hypothetical protein LKE85_06380 [Lachnospiraceae bacterium]|nr:hypothetical protein [Lachnospiraceae bacterium]